MTPQEQIDALKQASELIFSVEMARKNSGHDDMRQAGYWARCELARIENQCLVELGTRKG